MRFLEVALNAIDVAAGFNMKMFYAKSRRFFFSLVVVFTNPRISS
jgi:hypothetical protein